MNCDEIDDVGQEPKGSCTEIKRLEEETSLLQERNRDIKVAKRKLADAYCFLDPWVNGFTEKLESDIAFNEIRIKQRKEELSRLCLTGEDRPPAEKSEREVVLQEIYEREQELERLKGELEEARASWKIDPSYGELIEVSGFLVGNCEENIRELRKRLSRLERPA